MSAELKNKINDISMLLVMTPEGDGTGLKFIGEELAALEQLAGAPEHERLRSAIAYVRTKMTETGGGVIELLNAFASSALQFLENQVGVIFPHETPLAKSAPAGEVKTQTSVAADTASGSYVITGEKDILIEFAAEAEEHLANVEEIILDAGDTLTKDQIDTVFRGVHSLKGGSAYFSLEEITKTSHLLESILDEVRAGKRSWEEQLKELVLRYIDLEKQLISGARRAIEKDGTITRTQSASDFLNDLKRYSAGESAAPAKSGSEPKKTESVETRDSETKTSEGQGDKGAAKAFVKIDTLRLDQLIDSIGEMVIYSSMLVRLCRQHLGTQEEVINTTHRVEKFARDLQDIGMSMRLVPIKSLFQKMSRLAWDTSKKLGKEITFDLEGEDTELDRNLIDKLADPLMHMIRNAVDHGVEMPDERKAKGKSRTGKVALSAYHSGGSIHIKIEDDGKGLDPEKLVKKAIEKGIIHPDDKLSEQEIFQLIFAPGFSTAATVTDVSGRGVGMDVVRRNVESLRGHIHIRSTVNMGSVFTIELPLTLAIIDGIEVRVGRDCFIIPSLSIVEFLRPKASSISCALDKGETFHFRGKYLPVFRLADLYGIRPQFTEPTEATLVIVESNQEHVALMVDEIVGEYSTVIKSLGPMFQEGKGVSGCAIMPDGEVSLILDVRHLVQLARAEYRRDTPSARQPCGEHAPVSSDMAVV